MYCQNCGSFVGENVRFCQSCGKSQAPVPLPVVPTPNVAQVPRQNAPPKKQSKVFWLIMGGILLAIIAGIIGKSPSGSSTSTSTTQQSSAPNTPQQPNIATPSIPPPKFRIYKFKLDEPTSVVVPVNTTDEQLKSLLWFFREKVRSNKFKDIGLTKATAKQWGNAGYLSGMLSVYRGEKCANELYIDTNGPCGYGEHDDALYQWGIEGDPNKDSGSIKVQGDDIVVFNYEDNWHPSSEVSQVGDDKVKEAWKTRQEEWEPRQRFAVQIANEFLRRGVVIDVSANSDEPKELDFRSKLFSNTTFRKTFTDDSIPKMRPDVCKAGFKNIRVLTEGESDVGQSYPLQCRQ
jgi:hypothetical protein